MRGIPAVLITSMALLAGILAGCIGGDEVDPATSEDDAPEQADEVEVTATTGSLKGTVASDLFEPLGGALVSIVEAELETKVAKNGEFVINDVEPGFYTIFITALGYESTSRAAQINAGEVTEIAVQLVPMPSDDPYVVSQEFVGLVSWAAAWQLEGPVGCIVQDVSGVWTVKNCGGIRGGGSVNGEVPINVTEDVKTVVVEMVWDPAGPLGEFLQLDLMCPEVPRGDSGGAVLDTEHVCYFDTPGSESPLVHRVDEQHWLDNGYNHTGNWASRVFATYGMLGTYDSTGMDIGVAYEQTFRIYTNVFHKEAAPEGFSGIPDA